MENGALVGREVQFPDAIVSSLEVYAKLVAEAVARRDFEGARELIDKAVRAEGPKHLHSAEIPRSFAQCTALRATSVSPDRSVAGEAATPLLAIGEDLFKAWSWPVHDHGHDLWPVGARRRPRYPLCDRAWSRRSR